MALEQRLNLKQTLQLRMTPQLRQAIKILQVSRAELETMIGDELCQNPTLEEQEATADEAAQETRTGDVESTETEKQEAAKTEPEAEANDLKEVDWEDFLERYSGDFHDYRAQSRQKRLSSMLT
jgi:RNA polymerase sigma-54 factor